MNQLYFLTGSSLRNHLISLLKAQVREPTASPSLGSLLQVQFLDHWIRICIFLLSGMYIKIWETVV